MSHEATELQGILDEFEHECFMLRVEASETRARDDVVRKSYERIRDEFAGRIAATLGSGNTDIDDVLTLLDEIREAGRISYDDYSQLFDAISELGSGTCELHDCEGSFSALNRPVWRCDCGAFMTQYTDATTYHKPRFCPNCGRKAVE